MNMDKDTSLKSKAARKKEVDARLEAMTREELLAAFKEKIVESDEIAVGARALMNHLKVLCHRNGGTLTYTKAEFDAAAKDDPDLAEKYAMEGKKEICILTTMPKEKADPAAK